MRQLILMVLVLLAFVGLLLFGCFGQGPSLDVTDKTTTTNVTNITTITTTKTCETKECFISAANNCENISLKSTEEYGAVNYSAKDCVFTKTIVGLNDNETQEMQDLLEGKYFTCNYTKGNFDQNWTASLMFGIENCEGELREIIGMLMIFA